jgi:hypothetical protein
MEQNLQAITTPSRIRRSTEAIRNILADQQQSKISVKECCQVNDLSEKPFYRWIKKYRSKRKRKLRKKQDAHVGFASIEVVGNISNSNHPQVFAEIGKIRLYKGNAC